MNYSKLEFLNFAALECLLNCPTESNEELERQLEDLVKFYSSNKQVSISIFFLMKGEYYIMRNLSKK